MAKMRVVLIRTVLVLSLANPALSLAENKEASPAPNTSHAALEGLILQGTVLETMNSNGYTYLQLDAKQGRIWIAIPEIQVKAGQSVTCSPGITMYNFSSKTLNRTFEAIVFSPGLDKSNATSASKSAQPAAEAQAGKESGFEAALRAEGSATQGHDAIDATSQSTGSAGAVVPSTELNVNKATGPNSYSVSECFEQGKALNGKTVRVRGKVMKISRMIMGKHWLHIQDGTGDPLKNQHDLVVTTTEDTEEGKVITLVGTLAFERDFGAGYKYEVIVEDAQIEP